MKQQIAQLVRKLQIEYAAFFITAAAFAGVFELNPEARGGLVENVTLGFALQCVCIIATLAVVPLSLKAFSVLVSRLPQYAPEARVAGYRLWSRMRLLSLLSVAVFDIWIYYAMLDNIGGFCALICIVTALFCCPSRQRVMSDFKANDD